MSSFCDKYGLSGPYLTKVLNGQANIGIDQLEKYAKCFDMTLEAFLYPLVCQTAHCGRRKPHFDFGEVASPIVPYRHLPQTLRGLTADCRSLV